MRIDFRPDIASGYTGDRSMPTSRITVRPAQTPADFTHLVRLIKCLAEYESLVPPDAEAQDRLVQDGLMRQPARFHALLAEIDGEEPCAYAIFFETYSTFLCRPTLYLEDIFVLPERRANGVGTAMIRSLVHEAIERDCGRMEWTCLDWNINAQKFYDRIGAKHMAEWFFYRLDRAGIERFAGEEP
jgi:GNAT superfamily N-acetyltransferase